MHFVLMAAIGILLELKALLKLRIHNSTSIMETYWEQVTVKLCILLSSLKNMSYPLQVLSTNKQEKSS